MWEIQCALKHPIHFGILLQSALCPSPWEHSLEINQLNMLRLTVQTHPFRLQGSPMTQQHTNIYCSLEKVFTLSAIGRKLVLHITAHALKK